MGHRCGTNCLRKQTPQMRCETCKWIGGRGKRHSSGTGSGSPAQKMARAITPPIEDEVRALATAGKSKRDISDVVGIAYPLVYRILNPPKGG